MTRITMNLDYTGNQRNMALRAYVWADNTWDIVSSIELADEDEVVMACTGYLKVRDAVKFFFAMDPEADITFDISAEARNYLDREGRLKKTEGAFTMGCIAA